MHPIPSSPSIHTDSIPFRNRFWNLFFSPLKFSGGSYTERIGNEINNQHVWIQIREVTEFIIKIPVGFRFSITRFQTTRIAIVAFDVMRALLQGVRVWSFRWFVCHSNRACPARDGIFVPVLGNRKWRIFNFSINFMKKEMCNVYYYLCIRCPAIRPWSVAGPGSYCEKVELRDLLE